MDFTLYQTLFVIANCESCQGVALLLGVVPKAERDIAGLYKFRAYI